MAFWLFMFLHMVGASREEQPQPTASLITRVEQSGRAATVGVSADRRTQIVPTVVPGQPPALSFRYYEGAAHRRFSNTELMLDDAGH